MIVEGSPHVGHQGGRKNLTSCQQGLQRVCGSETSRAHLMHREGRMEAISRREASPRARGVFEERKGIMIKRLS